MNEAPESTPSLRRIACAIPGQSLYLLGDDGVVYSETQNRFAGLSAAGVSAYLAFDAGMSVKDLAAFSRNAAYESHEAIDTIAALARGIFPGEDPLITWSPLQSSFTANVRIHDLPVLVEFPPGPPTEICRDCFRNFPPSAERAKCHISARPSQKGWTVYVNGCRLLSSLADEQLGLGFLYAARSLLYAESRYDAACHAAMVADGAGGILLSGPREAGKSTLAAYLVSCGFALLTDEPALLDVATGCVSSLYLPFSLKERSWPLLGDAFPQLAGSPIHVRSDGVRIKLLHMTAGNCSTQPRRITHIVFPEYRSSCATHVERVSPLQALHLLNEAGSILAKALPRHKFEALLQMICDAPACTLQYSCLPEAASVIGRLTSEA